MASFYCDKCGALCSDTPRGYISGCEHYPPDLETCPMCGTVYSIKELKCPKCRHCERCDA